jgi:hypothetical protein
VAERENRLREREGLCGLGVFGCGRFSYGEKRMGMACEQSREGRESEGMNITNLVSKEGGSLVCLLVERGGLAVFGLREQSSWLARRREKKSDEGGGGFE